jgi:hypothetical protein
LLRIARLLRISRLLRRVISGLLGHTAECHAAPGAESAAGTCRGSAIGADGRQGCTACVTEFLSGSIIGAASGASYPLLHFISPSHP